jgi:MFS transporter, PAT family, beta-lactamase induction signal transducer AmpG
MQATIASTDAERVPFWSALIRDRRIAPAMGLGFTSGMPFLLTYSTQSAWLTDAGVPLTTIGLLSELTLAYKFKFVWAPFLDQYDPPLIGGVLRRRRGWLLVAILVVMAMLAGIALGDPGHWIWWTVGFSFALGIAGATLDLVLDGWRITSVRPPEKQAVLSSWTEIGYRVGNLAAGAGALYLADHIGWRGAYLCMAALMLVGIVATLLAPEPPSDILPHKPQAGFAETIWARSMSSSRGSAQWRSRFCYSSRASACRATFRTRWRCRSSNTRASRTPTSRPSLRCSASGSRLVAPSWPGG